MTLTQKETKCLKQAYIYYSYSVLVVIVYCEIETNRKRCEFVQKKVRDNLFFNKKGASLRLDI